jgi:2-methylcitrate dehydratase
VAFKGNAFEFERPFGSYVMENVLFKISFPAEFHAQTAVECAMKLHGQVAGKLDQIEKIVIETQEAGAASSTRPARWPTTPTATTASSTWSPCR